MTPQERDDVLQRIFPGDPVPDVIEEADGVIWVHQQRQRSAPSSLPEPRLAFTPTPTPTPRPRVLPSRLVEHRTLPPPPDAPPLDPDAVTTLPTRQYLLENPANAALWVREARQVEHDLTVGQRASAAHVTRLLLEAIPVVAQLVK